MMFDVPLFCMKRLDKLTLLSQLNGAIKRCSGYPPFPHQVRKPRARSITVVMKAFGLPTTTSTLRNALHHNSLAADDQGLHSLLDLVADSFLRKLLSTPPPLDQAGCKVATWNVTSLTPCHQDYKTRLAQRLARDRIVCLQETKMTEEDARLLQLQTPGVSVVSSPAVPSKDQANTGISGGVAILLPTYLCTTNFEAHTLIPGYAIAVTLALRSFQCA